MFSILKPNYVYRDFSEDIADHDNDFEAEEWNYNGRDVFRGSADPAYPDWNVYWLYDDNLIRVGLAEHDSENPEIFHSLWFHDTPFGTLLQEDGWVKKNVTLWSLLSPEAYQDCLEDDFKTVFDRVLGSNIRLMTPEFITNPPKVYHCENCNKKSLQPLDCQAVKVLDYEFSNFSILFLDESFVLYTAPNTSRIWSILSLQAPDGSHAPLMEQPESSSELADQLASQPAQSPPEADHQSETPRHQQPSHSE
jgi:hypothetical protein